MALAYRSVGKEAKKTRLVSKLGDPRVLFSALSVVAALGASHGLYREHLRTTGITAHVATTPFSPQGMPVSNYDGACRKTEKK